MFLLLLVLSDLPWKYLFVFSYFAQLLPIILKYFKDDCCNLDKAKVTMNSRGVRYFYLMHCPVRIFCLLTAFRDFGCTCFEDIGLQ